MLSATLSRWENFPAPEKHSLFRGVAVDVSGHLSATSGAAPAPVLLPVSPPRRRTAKLWRWHGSRQLGTRKPLQGEGLAASEDRDKEMADCRRRKQSANVLEEEIRLRIPSPV